MSLFKGTSLVEGSRLYTRSDSGGITTSQKWEGRKAEIRDKRNALALDGWTVQESRRGGAWVLEATFAGDPDDLTAQPSDQWTWRTENITRDGYSHPRVAKVAAAYDVGDPAVAGSAGYAKQIEESVRAGKGYDAAFPDSFVDDLDQTTEGFYRMISMGLTGYEVNYFVLNRRRFYSPKYVSRVKLDAVSKIYSTTNLIVSENIPTTVQAALPDQPTDEPGFMKWGWRRRDDGNEYDGANKLTETTSWVYALWSKVYYTYVP